MASKKQDIVVSSARLFNREGYCAPGIDRIVEAAGVSKMTFYRHFPDKDALIVNLLEEKLAFFLSGLNQEAAKYTTVKERLFCLFQFYHRWFNDPDFNGCMFTRAVAELGRNNERVIEINSRLKGGIIALFRDILATCLKPEPAERVAFIAMMLIDGAIAAAQSRGMETRENPPALAAWMALKVIIYSEGGRL
ncbi:TetR/AcrR family transcriptional regulator [Martelella alba]|uniref:TetR/AcrR family transcriptional regulator n=1 Tax=Martelella alba TaxID=2590451 RepID=A0ABY2SGM2_9HYPH|nr:TetR/AcrR family transcriptional regulator [Martelella alba]TKI04311.1 TetR/AcrR family transcriptional regulator [Martelella alba]